MTLNPYKIHWALYIDGNNVLNMNKSIHAPNKESLMSKLASVKGQYYIITDKQFGLIQNSWTPSQELVKNTKLSVHLKVKNQFGHESLIPLTKKQFDNPVIK